MFGFHYMPLWVFTLSSYLKGAVENISVDFYDLRFDCFGCIENSDIFAFSAMNQDYDDLYDTVERLRKVYPNAIYLIGGPITWSYEMVNRLDKLSCFDHVFIGDGEVSFPAFVRALLSGQRVERVVKTINRFKLQQAKAIDLGLLVDKVDKYYGGIIEVSRGCPFLCEFCDIRVMPDNNSSNNKNVDVILEELNFYHENNISEVLFACDNVNGDIKWLESLCDKIIDWRKNSGASISIYTWATIDISFHRTLLNKMRLAGFDMLYIGIESFHKNSLMETAKVQNTNKSLPESIKKIQSYGFIVVAGMIMGFDSEPSDIHQINIDGICESGLISGEVSPLVALPGTPLFKRLELEGRLILDAKKDGLGYNKYSSNIMFLGQEGRLKHSFLNFHFLYNSSHFQLKRWKNFLQTLKSSNYVDSNTGGYANTFKLVFMAMSNFKSAFMFVWRFAILLRPDRLFTFVYAFILGCRSGIPNFFFFFKFWTYMWTNSLLKNSKENLKQLEFRSIELDKVQSIDHDDYFKMKSENEGHKWKVQRKFTREALAKIGLK